MIDTLRLTAKQVNDLLETGEASSDEIFSAYRAAIDERDGELNCFLHVERRRARRGHPDRPQGPRQHEGHPDDGRLQDPRGLPPGLRRDRRRALQGARAARDRQDEHGRVRDGLVDGELRLRPDPEPVGPGSRARRLVGRLGSRGRRRPRPRGRSAPTPAARSSSRLRSAASSGSGRPTAPSPAPASSPSPPASTRSARSRRPSPTARSSTP